MWQHCLRNRHSQKLISLIFVFRTAGQLGAGLYAKKLISAFVAPECSKLHDGCVCRHGAGANASIVPRERVNREHRYVPVRNKVGGCSRNCRWYAAGSFTLNVDYCFHRGREGWNRLAMIRAPRDLTLLNHQPLDEMTEGRRDYMPVCLKSRSFLMN